MTNLEFYNKVRAVPKEAQRKIGGGKLAGKTDINPMWRIKTLTEQFGICGIGWYYEIINQQLEVTAGGEVACFITIKLYIKHEDEWSKGIIGIGGNMFINSEFNKYKDAQVLAVNDECFKMALTDALSVACKALGIGADIYWDKDKTKYDENEPIEELIKPTSEQLGQLKTFNVDINNVATYFKTTADKLTAKQAQWAIDKKKPKTEAI